MRTPFAGCPRSPVSKKVLEPLERFLGRNGLGPGRDVSRRKKLVLTVPYPFSAFGEVSGGVFVAYSGGGPRNHHPRPDGNPQVQSHPAKLHGFSKCLQGATQTPWVPKALSGPQHPNFVPSG